MKTLPLTAKITKKGHLEIGDCDTVGLAEEFGTPLYVLCEQTIRKNCQGYTNSLKKFYPNFQVIYACKALCTTALLKLISQEGLGFDVSSGGELYTAYHAGVPMENIYFHGNNKSREEIKDALKMGIGYFVIDNIYEAKNLVEITRREEIKTKVLLRINPGIEAHTHEFIQTGKIDSKFGFQKEEVFEVVKTLKREKFIDLVGLHAHIGSQILDIKPFLTEIDVLFELAKKLLDQEKWEILELNIGGGLGIKYTKDDNPPTKEDFVKELAKRMKDNSQKFNIPEPKLILEPGRSIIGQSGITLYTVGGIKNIPEIRKYIMIDGGMSDNIRPIIYGAKYQAFLANKMNQSPTETVTIAGRFCESGDILIKDIILPKIEVDDILAVSCTGAYCYSLANNYNRVGRPAMVLVNQGNACEIISRETNEDLVGKDI